MVSSSSKKIHKKHARYALTAGMMLGIRESVGGALGVEAELQISNWEGWERAWQEEEDNQGIAVVECNDDKEENDTHTVGEVERRSCNMKRVLPRRLLGIRRRMTLRHLNHHH